jgi:hypothetical protein
MSVECYLKEAVSNLETQLLNLGKQLPNKIFTPLAHKYRPELDLSPFLDIDFTQWYQQLTGQLRWAIELGRIDIHLPVALLAQHLATPRVGYLDQVFHIFAYVELVWNIVPDSIPEYSVQEFESLGIRTMDWAQFHELRNMAKSGKKRQNTTTLF